MEEPEQPEYYSSTEIMKLIQSKEELIHVEDELDEAIIRVKDIPDFIIDINRKFGTTNFYFSNIDSKYYDEIITTKGEQLDKIKPYMKEKIRDRLVALQKGEIKPNKFKLIDIQVYRKMKELLARSSKRKERGAR